MKKILINILLLIPLLSNANNLTPVNPRLKQDNLDKIITTCNLKELRANLDTCFPQNIKGYSISNVDINKVKLNQGLYLRYIWANTLNIRELGISTKDLANNIEYIEKSLEKERVEVNSKSEDLKNKKTLQDSKIIEIDYTTFFSYKTPYQYDLEYVELNEGKDAIKKYKELNEKIIKNSICKKNVCSSTVFSFSFLNDSSQLELVPLSKELESYMISKYINSNNIKALTTNQEKLTLRLNVHLYYTINGGYPLPGLEEDYKQNTKIEDILDTGDVNYE